MKRSRTIVVNGNSGLGMTVKITCRFNGRKLAKFEQDRAWESITDTIYRACLQPAPYHEIHASDVSLK